MAADICTGSVLCVSGSCLLVVKLARHIGGAALPLRSSGGVCSWMLSHSEYDVLHAAAVPSCGRGRLEQYHACSVPRAVVNQEFVVHSVGFGAGFCRGWCLTLRSATPDTLLMARAHSAGI